MGKIDVMRVLQYSALLSSMALGACAGADQADGSGQACDPMVADSCAQGMMCVARAQDATSFECQPECQPEDDTSCAEGLVCEQLGGADHHACLAPVVISGRVYGALDAVGVADATIVALDANGAARTLVARSDADGHYELPISVQRNADGSPAKDAITLRVAAADYQDFPLPPREALPIELEQAERTTQDAQVHYSVHNAATDVALIPLPPEQRGGATISGVVGSDPAGGVLVLAVAGDQAEASAISGSDGAFVLFNVKPGTVTLQGYSAGVAIAPQSVSMTEADMNDVQLLPSTAKLSTVRGSVNLVNADGGLTTSVILAVASTFEPKAARGQAPAGLRAAHVSSSFEIPNVPPGRYAVLAAFENDSLVRDPDSSIAGTDIVFVDVAGDGAAVTLDQSFKVTGALDIVSPGSQGTEQVSAGTIQLRWADDSSENGYELRVYDALGTLVHEDTAIASVSGSDVVSYPFDATHLEPGMLYQFRVWSWREKPKNSVRTYISASEDLRGVFQIAR